MSDERAGTEQSAVGTSAATSTHIEPIQTILDALIGREPTENEWENVPALAALRQVEQTLEGEGWT